MPLQFIGGYKPFCKNGIDGIIKSNQCRASNHLKLQSIGHDATSSNAPRARKTKVNPNTNPRAPVNVFLELLSVVKETGLSALIATHNFDLANRMDRKLKLEDGRLIDMREENFISEENFY